MYYLPGYRYVLWWVVRWDEMILDTWDGTGDSKRDGWGLCQLAGSTVLPCLLVHSLGLQQTTHIAFHSTLSSQLLTLAISLFIVCPSLMFCRSWCIVTLFGAVEFGAIGANSNRILLDTTTARADAHNALPSRNKSIRSAHRHLYNYVTANRAVLLLHWLALSLSCGTGGQILDIL